MKVRRAAEVGHIHHAGQSLRSDQAAERRAHSRRERNVGVPAAEHHHGAAGLRHAVRGEA